MQFIINYFLFIFKFSEEIARQLKDSNAKALITIPALWSNVQAALNAINSKMPVITIKTKVILLRNYLITGIYEFIIKKYYA